MSVPTVCLVSQRRLTTVFGGRPDLEVAHTAQCSIVTMCEVTSSSTDPRLTAFVDRGRVAVAAGDGSRYVL